MTDSSTTTERPDDNQAREHRSRRFCPRRPGLGIGVVLIAAVILGLNRRSAYLDIAPHVENAGGTYAAERTDSFFKSLILRAQGRGGETWYSIQFAPGRVSDTWLREQRFRLERLGVLLLVINNPRVTDEGIRQLANVRGILWLDLAGCSITDEGLASLDGLQTITSLSLLRTKVTDASVAALLSMPVRSVILAETPITDQGVAQLVAGKRIAGLGVDSGQLTPVSVAALKQAEKLSWFSLYDADDRSIALLPDLKLQFGLVIQGTRFTAASLPVLELLIQSGSFKKLTLLDFPLSVEELQKLKQIDDSLSILSTSSHDYDPMLNKSRP